MPPHTLILPHLVPWTHTLTFHNEILKKLNHCINILKPYVCYIQYMNTYKNKTEKFITLTVFTIYLMFLTWLVLFKLAVSTEMIPHMRGINLIPFYYDKETSFHFKEVLFNIVVFIPAGFYFTAINKNKGILRGVKAVLLLSISYELIQLIFGIGATDITDVITNTAGGFLGMILFVILGKIRRVHRLALINTLGLMMEAGTLVLVTVIMTTAPVSLFIFFLEF